MHKTDIIVIIAQKIGRVISGQATEREIKDVRNWANSSPDNMQLLDKIVDNYALAAHKKQLEKIDTNVAWSRFENRQAVKESSKRIVRLSYAAMMIVMMTLGAVVYNLVSHQKIENTTKQSLLEISPGVDKAVLYTTNGNKIELDKSSDGVVDTTTNAFASLSTLNYVKSKASVSMEVYDKLVVPKGGQFHLILADSSEVWLNSSSTIRYYVYGLNDKREIWLTGEAYFKVKANNNKPFIVISEDNRVEVLGTEFNITAYSGGYKVKTTLVEGKVNVSTLGNPTNIVTLDKMGMQSLIDKGSKIEIRSVDVREYTAWRDGAFYFNHTPLRDIVKALALWYNFDYLIVDKSLERYHFSGEFKRFENIDNILKIIKLTGIPIDITCENNTIIMNTNK